MTINTLEYSTIFQAELDKHLMKYTNIYGLETNPKQNAQRELIIVFYCISAYNGR